LVEAITIAFLLPIFSHVIVALAFGLAVKPTMRWGNKILEFNKDGTIRAVRSSQR